MGCSCSCLGVLELSGFLGWFFGGLYFFQSLGGGGGGWRVWVLGFRGCLGGGVGMFPH